MRATNATLCSVTIYREGRPDDLLRFDDRGSLVRQAYRPVFRGRRDPTSPQPAASR